MREYTAGHISTAEAAALLETVQQRLGSDRLQFYPGVSYRNLLVVRGGGQPAPFSPETLATPPHDLTDQPVAGGYPRGPGSELLVRLMDQSAAALRRASGERRPAGKRQAARHPHLALGPGTRPPAAPFAKLHGKQGAMITAVDLLRGLAKLHRLAANRRARRHRLHRHRLCRQGPLCGGGLEGHGLRLRPRRGDRRGLAPGRRGRQDRGPPADRPAHRRPALGGGPCRPTTPASSSVPIIRRFFARGRTVTATCPLRWPVWASSPTPPCITTIRRPPVRRWYSPRAGS